jgi:branched-subunit amino acid aminotransferase/4-amino-4-deoxychorismate lyase
MPIPLAILTSSGDLIETPYHVDSLEQASLKEPEGVYTVTRTYHGDKAVLLDAHFDRLEESADIEGIPTLLDRSALRASLRTLIAQVSYPEARIRLTIPRSTPDQIILGLEPLKLVTEEMRRRGVHVATLLIERFRPRSKSTTWVERRAAAMKMLPKGAYEGIILTDSDELTEGFSSNFYGIRRGVLHTAKTDILEGISRRILLHTAPEVLPVEPRRIHLAEIPSLDETFLTSSGRGVLAIVSIDGILIGKGTPGPRTKEIASHYDAWVEAHLEPI